MNSEKTMTKAAFFGDAACAPEIDFLDQAKRRAILPRVFTAERRERIAELCALHPVVISAANIEEQLSDLAELEVIFATWGMPYLTREQIAAMPALKMVCYAAGSVQRFARPFLENGIHMVSAAEANALPVAEFTQAQIILANKGYFRNTREYSSPEMLRPSFRGVGNFRTTVAVLGAGMIGTKVIELLKPFDLDLLVFDPFLTDDRARALGVAKVGLIEAFEQSMVVSNHLANKAETKRLLKQEHFTAMLPGAVFINTGRGATVDEPGLIQAMELRPDLTALLDVTESEPPAPNSPLFPLSNIIVSGHIAGSINNEIPRMADLVIAEFENWLTGRPLRHEVTLEMLDTMA